jgi:hypothetical protein
MKTWPAFTSALAQRNMGEKKIPNISSTLNFFVGDSSKHMVQKSNIQTKEEIWIFFFLFQLPWQHILCN